MSDKLKNELRPVNNRLRTFIDYKYNGNFARFAEELGISRQRLHKYMNPEVNSVIPVDLIVTICRKHPALNSTWLLFGDGAMEDGLKRTVKVNPVN